MLHARDAIITVFPMPLPATLPAFFARFLKAQPFAFLSMTALALFWSVNEVAAPYFLKMIIDRVADHQGDRASIFSVVAWPLGAAIALRLMMEAAMRIQGWIGVYAFSRLQAQIRKAMFDHLQRHSYAYFQGHFAGSLGGRVTEMARSSQNIVNLVIVEFVPIFVAFMLSIMAVWTVHASFAAVLTAWVAVFLGVSLVMAKRCQHLSMQHSEDMTALRGTIVDSISNSTTVRLFARHRHEGEHLRGFQDTEVASYRSAKGYVEKLRMFFSVIAVLLVAAMLVLLLEGWKREWVTVGDFALISGIVMLTLGMSWWVANQLIMLFEELGVCAEALQVVSVPWGVVDMPEAPALVISRGEVVFDHVTFRYQRNSNLFEEMNLVIPAGQKVGLVGYSGSGKTTFTHMLMRHFDIASGRILIDGQDIAGVQQESLRAQIAVIPQDTQLFHRSLMENIRYGHLEAADEEVIAAAKKAHAHEFIEALPEGYQALVGERGIKLSGGQRQRIAIARAILKNAKILVLDEATSALDSMTEKYLQESLENLMAHATTVVIAHRLSTLRAMDRILMFHQGRIIEDGTQKELLEREGHFAELWRMQSGGMLPESRS
ncbi:MAG: ABC transporter ATP-binding protein [Alphaproteobacteria bacterium]|nr:ABC transporter ATP-binding protein [Alphaproteobacteria bacterium]